MICDCNLFQIPITLMQFEADSVLPSLTGSTLVVACVSVGNVGQLATDVILATLHK